MTAFPLKIVSPDGLIFHGEAEGLTVHTTEGDVGILARHIDYVAALGIGQAVILSKGEKHTAACIGGMITVKNGAVTLVATTFEWAGQIDPERADRALARAQERLNQSDISDLERKLAEARLKRALVRKSVYTSR